MTRVFEWWWWRLSSSSHWVVMTDDVVCVRLLGPHPRQIPSVLREFRVPRVVFASVSWCVDPMSQRSHRLPTILVVVGEVVYRYHCHCCYCLCYYCYRYNIASEFPYYSYRSR